MEAQTFLGIFLGVFMGSLTQTVLGKSLQALRGMKMGKSWHFFSGTFLHLVRGTCFSTLTGIWKKRIMKLDNIDIYYDYDTLDILFYQITKFIKVPMACVFRLQIL